MAVKKAAGGVEDLTFGLGYVTQLRNGQPIRITQINASHIPFGPSQSVVDKIGQLEGSIEANRQAITRLETPEWGSIVGDIEKQTDLVELVSSFIEIGSITRETRRRMHNG